MLNKALRAEDFDMLFAIRYFITDLETQLTSLHNQINAASILKVYHAQLISPEEFNYLNISVGEFISMNSSLLTSIERSKMTEFLSKHYPSSDQLQHVLFESDIDPSIETKPYTDISVQNFYSDEHKVLFMIECIFRMRRIWRESTLYIIHLELCTERDHQFDTIFAHLKEQLGEETDLCTFGKLLFEMAEYDKAESYYQRLLNEISSADQKTAAACFHGFGVIARRRGEFDLAILHHEKSLQHLTYYTQVHEIKFIQAGCETPDTASTYNKALQIQQECLPADHQSTGKTYGCMGHVYFNQSDNINALEYYNKSLPLTHQFIGITYHDLGSVYERIENLVKALDIYTLQLLPTRQRIVDVETALLRIREKLNEPVSI